MREPFHETLYTYSHLSEQERLASLTRDAEGLQTAKRAAIAFHEPEKLADERSDLLDRLGTLPDPADALARGLQMVEDLKKIDARREEAAHVD